MQRKTLTGASLRLRKSFGQIPQAALMPDLIGLQKQSYESFLQKDVSPEKRENKGLQAVFHSVFPVSDYNGKAALEFVKYTLSHPKYDVSECRQRGMTYSSVLKVTLRLALFDNSPGGSASGPGGGGGEAAAGKSIRDIKEQEVYLSEIPLMTDGASFIINGTERVIVSQLHRSPGVFFDHDSGKGSAGGKYLYFARVIPYRGSWLDFEFDQKDLVHARIDRKRKFPATILLKAIGCSQDEILGAFYRMERVQILPQKDLSEEKKAEAAAGAASGIIRHIDIEKMEGWRVPVDIKDAKGAVLARAGRRVTRSVIRKVKAAAVTTMRVDRLEVKNLVTGKPIIDKDTGEILLESNREITPAVLDFLLSCAVREFEAVFFDSVMAGPYIANTLRIDKTESREEALLDLFRRMKPGEPPSPQAAEKYVENLFFNENSYNLGKVGRVKINRRFQFKDVPDDFGALTKKDILTTVLCLVKLKSGQSEVDDIDHLGNRRVRSVGELLENQYRIGLIRMERGVKEKMNLLDEETMMPHDLVNAKAVGAVVKEFFGSSQLSQFMDQTNPLAEITHKRRMSAFGPGGLTRDRAGFEVRDVHPTHYGRICPIETPEGPNIGLITSLASFARINEHGFIETPYCTVKDGKAKEEIRYYSALDEQSHVVVQARADFNDLSPKSFMTARVNGEYKTIKKEEASLMDVSPKQLVSVATSLIPFLEHNDANRALMGSNMQRQAVPLMISRAPLVGTGVEKAVSRDSGNSVICRHDGVVEDMDASRIVVRRTGKTGKPGAAADIYDLIKYQRTNQDTCFNQKPIVCLSDKVKKGDILAEGFSSDRGELALGKNILAAFTAWSGYNFEDSLLISEKLIKDDVYTSIHIEEYECLARDTKLGPEEITDDIANAGEEALSHLDGSGIVRAGTKVKPGDILVGKVTPKGETQLSPEKKLILAIFGEKAGEMKDSSLRAPSGVYGTVIDAQVYSREGAETGDRRQSINREKEAKLERDFAVKKAVSQNSAFDEIKDLLTGEKTKDALLSDDGSKEILKKGQVLDEESLRSVPFDLLAYIPLQNEALAEKATALVDKAGTEIDELEFVYKERKERIYKGDELAPGVIKMIKVYVAVKRKVQVGDKFSGRHGNKLVVSKTVPEEDMPYLADGTPVDMVLNPLGVPSRMNIGQILETHLGWAAYGLGRQIQKHLDRFNEQRAREALKGAYRDKKISEAIDQADEKSLREMIAEVKGGVHLAVPVFDGASETDVQELLQRAGLPKTGQTVLFDGRTGEPFDMPVTVGVMYMLKLHHLVEEKIHARSIGPYSLVSQQPLGGKSQFGGQKLGEMEVWAIEAYGAAYCLQEFLTVKSDDTAGRVRMYESVLKGENALEPGIPEAFNVLINEMKSLCLDVELFESEALTEKRKETTVDESEDE